jgi:hypothetical protein
MRLEIVGAVEEPSVLHEHPQATTVAIGERLALGYLKPD